MAIRRARRPPWNRTPKIAAMMSSMLKATGMYEAATLHCCFGLRNTCAEHISYIQHKRPTGLGPHLTVGKQAEEACRKADRTVGKEPVDHCSDSRPHPGSGTACCQSFAE